MMKIGIKAKGRAFSIPVPYALVNLSIGILTSRGLRAIANRAIEKHGKTTFQIPNINKKDFTPILSELSKQKGLVLVETSMKNGTKVSIKL
ncbi:hypothetical protein PU629_12410 [Pullulanibacillus sp. KACC 23026]|uniref:hypothetical protein n=1 Tax=Pullulanibacillus sp. KACC 23026 TaxID=3028315 RepID=UPI0023AF94CC|nr:hypothetical protein [Pullulanibacillus sp. KACC 23026]WEG10979.1 hypothetical protein PU629_12410 [Pullulanibacillus sp. KACC 23026]